MFTSHAWQLIHQSTIPNGILASTEDKDNYKRVWARDACITGIVSVWLEDEKATEGLQNSLITLQKHQAETGQIPSNISFENNTEKPSYGSLAGRVDATTWWIIACCTLIHKTQNTTLKKSFEKSIQKAIFCLQTWEFNNRNLLYIPLGGNWADEYVSSGYTLYDNALYFWAIQSAGILYENPKWLEKAIIIKETIKQNFQKNTNAEPYHPSAMQKTERKPYLYSSLMPNGYDSRFDMAANALALLLNINDKPIEIEQFLQQLQEQLKSWLLPVFFPVIYEKDEDWRLLSENYSYTFKNHPHHFHNGGSWPVFLGWLALGLSISLPKNKISHQILNTYENVLLQFPEHIFNEYYDTKNFKPNGTKYLCFSASGYLLMKLSQNKTFTTNFSL